MNELALAENDFEAIKNSLLDGANEKCAVLFAHTFIRADGLRRILVREIQFPVPRDYSKSGPFEVELTPEFVAVVTKRARTLGSSLVFVHSHPGADPPRFSLIDRGGEQRLAAFLSHRHPTVVHVSMVVSAGGVSARLLGTNDYARVVTLGIHRRVLCEVGSNDSNPNEIFDRQVRAFGSAGQRALEQLRVGIVGLGGTGSIVAEQLAHLGVRDFVLLDPDTLDATNLNRVAGATPSDIGAPKVILAEGMIRRIAPDAKVSRIADDVTRTRVARELGDADFLFGCTDSHGSRAVLQQIAYQYLVPYIDMGTTIATDGGRISHIVGRIQALAPGLACFACGGLLNANEVRRDLMSEFERKADPYFLGSAEPAPAVMSINGTVASLAVTMFLSMVSGMPIIARYLLYSAVSSSLRTVRGAPTDDCYVCSRNGAFARGDSWPLLGRLD